MHHLPFELDLDLIRRLDRSRYELGELETLAQAGLVQLDEHWIAVTPKGRMLVRNVCMVFDSHLRKAQSPRKFSRVI